MTLYNHNKYGQQTHPQTCTHTHTLIQIGCKHAIYTTCKHTQDDA